MNVAKNGDVHTVLRTVPDGNCAGSKWHVAKTTDFNTFQLLETDFNTFQLPEEPAAPAGPSRKECAICASAGLVDLWLCRGQAFDAFNSFISLHPLIQRISFHVV